MDKGRDNWLRGRNGSISAEYKKSSDYRSRSPSKSPHHKSRNRHNNKSPHSHNSKVINKRDRESDREHKKRSSRKEERKSTPRTSDYRDHSERSRSDRRSPDKSTLRRDDGNSSDSECSLNGAVIGASGTEIIGYKSEAPNNTIVVRRLAKHILEKDICDDIIRCGLMAKSIRLIRNWETGQPRGFAFVEFATIEEAVQWMEIKRGVLILQEQYRAIMLYTNSHKALRSGTADWFCKICEARNFKRRVNCYKCFVLETERENSSNEICAYLTKTIMIRNLDALTTEDSVMAVLNTTIPDLVMTVSAVCIGRDPLTSLSRGICYLETKSIIDAAAIHDALSNLPTPLVIDKKTVCLSYCKSNIGENESEYSNADVESLAEHAARKYAKTFDEYMQYIEYYRSYYTAQKSAGLHQENQMDVANAGAAVAESAIQQMYANDGFSDTTCMSIPNGTNAKQYPVPDVSKYTFDETTGYQYDPTTGLYYDPNSNYYWNGIIQKYLYWDQEQMTYVLAPMPSVQAVASETANNKPKKHGKNKVSKKIAKDIEKWVKIHKSKKQLCHERAGSSTDAGFAVLEKKNTSSLLPDYHKHEQEKAVPSSNTSSVAGYKIENESSEAEEEEVQHLDYAKLICNLCKRHLGSKESLDLHAKLSALHKQNLELKEEIKETTSEKVAYRHRTQGMKYGNFHLPEPNIETFWKLRELAEVPVTAPVGTEEHNGTGNKMAVAGEAYQASGSQESLAKDNLRSVFF